MNDDLCVIDNIHECNKYLSAFGRKVYGVLLNQYKTGEFTRSKYHPCKNTVNGPAAAAPWQRRNEKSNSLPGTNPNFINFNYDIDRNIFANKENVTNSPNYLSNVLSERENTPTIPKTAELLKRTEDLDTTAINTNLNMTTYSSENVNSQPIFSLNMAEHENNEILQSTQVPWEDMLDCKILNVDTFNDVENLQNVNKNNITENVNNNFELKSNINKNNCKEESKQLVIKNNIVEKAKEKNINGNKNKVIEHKNSKIKSKDKKRTKSNNTKVEIPKKVAKVTEKNLQPNFLKKKNKKAINNWLNDVDPTHLVDGIEIQDEVLITSGPNVVTENPNDILQTSLENVEFQDRHKKMVQARLINENGSMKFSKPNGINELTQSIDKENSTFHTIGINKIIKKSKFIAPIKSQNSSKNI